MNELGSWKKVIYRQIEEKGHASLLKTIGALAFDWGLIFLSITVEHSIPSFSTYAIAILVIASRQHALLVLMHEGAHGHLCKNRKWNDVISDVFTAWPLGVVTETYRAHHSAHHQYTNTALDPDWVRKAKDPNWRFPKKRAYFWKSFLPYLFGFGLVEMGIVLRLLGRSTNKKFWRAFFMAAGLSGLFFTGNLKNLLLFWVVPYFTILPLFMKVRSIVEHLALPNTSEFNGTRNIAASRFECFFFGPHANNWHLVHHLFPELPWHEVESAHRFLQNDVLYGANAYQNSSYFLPSPRSVYKDLVLKKHPTHFEENSHEKRAA